MEEGGNEVGGGGVEMRRMAVETAMRTRKVIIMQRKGEMRRKVGGRDEEGGEGW